MAWMWRARTSLAVQDAESRCGVPGRLARLGQVARLLPCGVRGARATLVNVGAISADDGAVIRRSR